MAVAELQNSQGDIVGMAVLTEGSDGVHIALSVFDLPTGVHALHIHAAGSCEAPDFKSAMGHFNPFERQHGLKNPQGAHAGDLPNIVVDEGGAGAFAVTAQLVTLGDGPNSLFREGGTALMIHAGPDDYVSDPAGAAGPRLACGVIRPLR